MNQKLLKALALKLRERKLKKKLIIKLKKAKFLKLKYDIDKQIADSVEELLLEEQAHL